MSSLEKLSVPSRSFTRYSSHPQPAGIGSQTILCIFHSSCADGFGAAWSLHHNMPHANIEFWPAKYDDKPEDIPNVQGRLVYMLDFSYKRNVMAYMLREAETFCLLDHHKSAAEALEGLDDPRSGRINFDMNRSGAMMAWDYFSKGKKPPPLICHIQDRDLWRFKLPGTREIQAAVFSYPYDLGVWDALMVTDTERLREEGTAIERKHFKDIFELLPETTRPMIIGGLAIPVANLPYTMASDAAHILAKGNDTKIGATYTDTAIGRKFSIRSTDDGPDVSIIATSYGGGGHIHAGGFIKPIGWEGDRYTKVEELPRIEETIADEALRNS